MYACVRMYVCVCICVILKRLYTQVHNVYMCIRTIIASYVQTDALSGSCTCVFPKCHFFFLF